MAQRRGLVLLAALFIAALALRPQLVGAGPLLPDIQADLGVSHAVAGLLGTIPVLCMGVFAPVAAPLAGRAGLRNIVGASVGAVALFGLARAAAPGAPLVLLLTLPIGVGMAIAGALLPVAVKERFPEHPAFANGVCTSGLNGGAAVASLFSVAAGAAAALMLLGGYLVAGTAPFGLGAIRDLTGSFSASLWALFGTALVLVCACLPLTATRLRPA